jgi:hypothetical protein
VQQKIVSNRTFDPIETTESVLLVVASHLSTNELDKIMRILPKDLQALWPVEQKTAIWSECAVAPRRICLRLAWEPRQRRDINCSLGRCAPGTKNILGVSAESATQKTTRTCSSRFSNLPLGLFANRWWNEQTVKLLNSQFDFGG